MSDHTQRAAARFAVVIVGCIALTQVAYAVDPVSNLECGLAGPNSVELTWDPNALGGDELIQSFGPIAYWRLGDTGTVAVDEIELVDGMVIGPVLQGEEGALFGDPDTSYRFPGHLNSYVEIPHNDAFLNDEGTVSLWVYPESMSGTEGVFSKDSHGFETGGHLRLRWEDRRFKVRLQSTTHSFFVQSSHLDPDCWYHVAIKWGNGELRLFVDGEQVDWNGYSGGLGTTSGGIGNFEPIVIGAESTFSDPGEVTPLANPFTGRVDDFSWFDRCLTETEIEQIAHTRIPLDGSYSQRVLDRDPVAYYEFDGLPMAIDSANGFNGTADKNVLSTADSPLPTGNAAIFEDKGGAGISVPLAPELQIAGDLTIAFWVCDPNKYVIVSMEGTGSGSGSNVLYEIRRKSDGFEYRHDTSSGDEKFTLDDNDSIASTGWTPVVITRNAATRTVRLYVNGVLQDSHTYSDDPFGGSHSSLTIGSRQGSNEYEGKLDEVVIGDSAWCAAEIRSYSTVDNRTFKIERDGVLIDTLDSGMNSFTDTGVSAGEHEYCVTVCVEPELEDCCEPDKPRLLAMQYTGENCAASMQTQDPGKFVCTGDPLLDPMVYILSTDSDDPNDTGADVYFAGDVALNGFFNIDAEMAGGSFSSATFFYVYDSLGGTLLQSVEFHTSCSQDLFVGNQFGSALLVACVDENQPSGTLPDITSTESTPECCTIRTPEEPMDLVCGPVMNGGVLEVGLTWTTNPGVEAYEIRRDGVVIATILAPMPLPASLQYTEIPPAPGDYTYSVAEIIDGLVGPAAVCMVTYNPAVMIEDCVVDGSTVVVTWMTTGVYDTFDILVDGVLDQTVPGSATQATVTGLTPPGATIGVVGVVSGVMSPVASCMVTIFDGPMNPTCCASGDEVEVCWTLAGPVDEVIISRDGVVVGSVTNGTSCFTDFAVPAGPANYSLQSRIGNNLSLPSTCSTVVLTPPSLIDCLATSSSCDPQGAATISWTNTATYDEIEVFVDGVSAGVLLGTDQQIMLSNIASTSIVIDVVARRTMGACAEAGSQCSIVFEIDDLPELTVTPINLLLCPGDTTTLSGMVTGGSTPITLQWLLDGMPISGATSASYTIGSASAADAGAYSLAATNLCGTTTVPAGPIAVRTPLSIDMSPMATSACLGDPFSFSVSVSGTGPFTYQWTLDGTAIPGADQPTYMVASASAADAGSYAVTVTGPCDSQTTAGVDLSVAEPPTAAITTVADPVCATTDLLLESTVTGTGPFTFAWSKDGSPIAGADQDSLLLSNISAADAGSYVLTVTSDCGDVVDSAPFTLVVLDAVTVTTSALPALLCEGDPLVVDAIGAGSGPLSFEWNRGGVTVSTMSTLDLGLADPSDNGTYIVTVTGACGSIDSAPVVIDVTESVTISAQPQGGLICDGSAIDLSVTATGGGMLAYQWFFNGAPIAGATNPSLQISNPTAANSGMYTVSVENDCNSVLSDVADVTIGDLAMISIMSAATEFCSGTTVDLTATTNATDPIQWLLDGSPIAGETGLTLTASAAGTYTATATTECGSETSNAIVLTVIDPIAITAQPQGGLICDGSAIDLSVTATGGGTLAYQWFFNGAPIAGATNPTLQITNPTAANSGMYTVSVENECNTVLSNVADVVIGDVAMISIMSAATEFCSGTTTELTATTNATDPIQWLLDGSPIAGETGLTLTASAAGTYTAIATTECGSETSNAIVLTELPPTVVSQVTGAGTYCEGDTIMLSVTASGSGALTVEWTRDGVAVQSGPDLTLNIPNAQPSDSGQYTASVFADCGDVTSAALTVTVNPATVITTQPVSVSTTTGSSANFSVVAGGTGPFTYQWLLNGVNILGATSPTLTIPSVSTADLGDYEVIVSGVCGDVTSQPALLTTVGLPPVEGLSCCLNGLIRVEICWENPAVYDTLDVFLDGILIETLNGFETCTRDTLTSGPGVYTIIATAGSLTSPPADCTIIQALPPTIEVCEATDNGIEIQWTNPQVYSSIDVQRDGVSLMVLPGTATSFTDPSPTTDNHTYTIGGTLDAPNCSSVAEAVCKPGGRFIRGDGNMDGNLNLTDVILCLGYLFGGDNGVPPCLDAMDTNDSGSATLPDAVYLASFLFNGGTPPPAPYPTAGLDPTEDLLTCENGQPLP